MKGATDMKKKLLQITLTLIITFIAAGQAVAMVSCEDAQPGEACSLVPVEELEEMGIRAEEEAPQAQVQVTTLPSNGDKNAPGVTLIKNQKLASGKIQIVGQKEAKGYQSPSISQFRSPLSKAGI